MGTHPIFESDFDCLTDRMSRRISTFTDEYGNPTSIPMKIMSAWESGEGTQEENGPRKSIPRRMSVEEIAGLIDAALESAPSKKSVAGRDQIMKSASDLADIINRSIEDQSITDKSMSYNDLARFLASSLSPDNLIFAGDDELTADGPLTDDDLDIWKGLPSNEKKSSTARSPAVAQICSAISELSSTLGDLETTFTKKMEQFVSERPEVGQHVTTLKEDLSGLIQALSAKLSATDQSESDIEHAIDNELHNWETRRIKDAFVKEEQDQVERLNKQKADKKQEAERLREEKLEKMEKAEGESNQPRESGGLPPTMGRKSEAKSGGDKSANRRSVRRSRAGEPEGRSSTAERKGSILRRRKTSTGRRLGSTVRMAAGNADDEENVPEGPISLEQYLLGSVENKPKLLQAYIDQGGNVNSVDECRRTALHRAALYGGIESVNVLIRNKCKLNLQDKLGDTALHWACRGGDLQIVKLLVDNGAKVNAKDKLFSTPLHVAVRVGVQEIIEFLCDHNGDVNAKDREGDTPMHDAVRLGRYRVVKSLILHGANLRVKNQIGKSPVDMVQLWYKDTKANNSEARKKNSVAVKMTDLLNEHVKGQ